MTQDHQWLADFRRRIDEVRILVGAARRRHETGERLNLSELQALADKIRRMAGQPELPDNSTRTALRSALETTVSDLNALAQLVSASQANLARRITDAERRTGPHNTPAPPPVR